MRSCLCLLLLLLLCPVFVVDATCGSLCGCRHISIYRLAQIVKKGYNFDTKQKRDDFQLSILSHIMGNERARKAESQSLEIQLI